MTLAEFIAREVTVVDTGPLPCCRLFDRWVEVVDGYSILRKYGYYYETAAEAAPILARHGNIVFAMLHVAELDGAIETETPTAGDVGIIVHNGLACAAVHAGRVWFSRDEHGFIGTPVATTRLIKTWRRRCLARSH